jgi:phosphoserine phosphatase
VTELLPSWRPGPTRDAIVEFLDSVAAVPVAERVAYFDNDGTLWCERPDYVQLDFFVDELRRRAADDESLRERPEFSAVLGGDREAIAELGMVRVALALASLFEGLTPDEFSASVVDFMDRAMHEGLARPMRTIVYQPMLELLEELRRRAFTVGIVTGGGTEFVRAISEDLYGVPAELVVGTLIAYDLAQDTSGRPLPRRTGRVLGDANEGAAKVTNIQTQLGRKPMLAAGNSGGDSEMLEWACAGDGHGLAILIDHDDDDREFAYRSTAQTFAEAEPIAEVGARLGWTVVSMARDWDVVFPPAS